MFNLCKIFLGLMGIEFNFRTRGKKIYFRTRDLSDSWEDTSKVGGTSIFKSGYSVLVSTKIAFTVRWPRK